MDVNTISSIGPIVAKFQNVFNSGLLFGKSIADLATAFTELLPFSISEKGLTVLSVVTFFLVIYAVWKSSSEVIKYFLLALAVIVVLSVLGVL